MIALAGIVDFSQFILTIIPFVGWIASSVLSVCTWIFFGIWFSRKGMSLISTSRALGTLGAMLGEAAPFINAFPWWTARIAVAVFEERHRKGAV